MPASILYPLNKPLFTLTIEGTSDNSILRANQTDLLCRGSQQYCLDRREEILTARGYAIPETWDLTWDRKFGALWHPGLLDDTHFILWLTFDTAYTTIETLMSTDYISKVSDRTDYGHDFVSPLIWSQGPQVSLNSLNNFTGAQMDGATGYLKKEEEANDYFDIGLGSFCSVVVTDWGDDNDAREAIISNGNPSDFAIIKDFRASNQKINNIVGNVNNSINEPSSTESIKIIIGGRDLGLDSVLRLDGEENIVEDSRATDRDIDNANPMYLGRKHTGSFDYDGIIYEVMFFKVYPAAAIIEKLEGYLAHKYGKTSVLPSDHTYKTTPPRQVTT